MNADELYADELVVKVRALRNRIDVLEREQTRADVRLIEVEAERDALRTFAKGVIRYAGNEGNDYLADKAREALGAPR